MYCRLCAELKDSSEIIASIDDSKRSIEQKLVACCQWNVDNNDQIQTQDVCMFCLDKLEESWLFSQSVQLAQYKLLEIFGEPRVFSFSLLSGYCKMLTFFLSKQKMKIKSSQQLILMWMI